MLGTILVVDDNVKIVEVLEAYLLKEGFEVITATDGESAERLAAEQHIDLALLDVMLPGIDGIELTKRFLRRWNTPVILVTARTDEIDRLIGLEVGADDYVSKPFSPREVVARVRAVLRRMDRPSMDTGGAARVVVGELMLDADRRTAEMDGEQLDLTRTEFDVMWAMAAHPGRVYSRMQLLEIASGDSFEGYERTIDAHVKNLRRKLGDDPRAPRYIRTVFGVGYKIEVDR